MKQLFVVLCFITATVCYAQNPGTYRYKFATPIDRITLTDAVIKSSPYPTANRLLDIPAKTNLLLLGVYEGFYRVRYKDLLGFVHYVFIDGDYKKFYANEFLPDGLSKTQYDYENEPNDILYFAKIEYEKALYKNPEAYKDTLTLLPEDAIFSVTHQNEKFWKATYNGQVGYIPKDDILRLGKTRLSVERAVESGPETSKEFMQRIDAQTTQYKKEVLKSPVHYKTRTSTVYYIRGPRGGCYYVTGSGRKQYVDRSLCN